LVIPSRLRVHRPRRNQKVERQGLSNADGGAAPFIRLASAPLVVVASMPVVVESADTRPLLVRRKGTPVTACAALGCPHW
jgi:hypothetical protein